MLRVMFLLVLLLAIDVATSSILFGGSGYVYPYDRPYITGGYGRPYGVYGEWVIIVSTLSMSSIENKRVNLQCVSS